MNLVRGYGSDSDEDSNNNNKQTSSSTSLSSSSSSLIINSAPDVNTSLHTTPYYINSTTTTLYHNPTVEELYKPLTGPIKPGTESQLGVEQGRTRNMLTGFVEKVNMNEYTFDDQYHTFIGKG